MYVANHPMDRPRRNHARPTSPTRRRNLPHLHRLPRSRPRDPRNGNPRSPAIGVAAAMGVAWAFCILKQNQSRLRAIPAICDVTPPLANSPTAVDSSGHRTTEIRFANLQQISDSRITAIVAKPSKSHRKEAPTKPFAATAQNSCPAKVMD